MTTETLDPSDRPLMDYVLAHAELGVFVGAAMGLAFWSRLDSVGQVVAATFASEEDALDFARGWAQDEAAVDLDALEVFAVASGHWRDLAAVGLDTGDMAANEIAQASVEAETAILH